MSPLRSSAGPAVMHERDVELGGEDLRERRLAQAGRAGEQHVVERLAARGGRLERDRELLLERVLADEVLEAARAQRALELVLGGDALGRLDRGVIGGPPRSALCDELLDGLAARRAGSSSSASAGGKPSSSRPSRASARGSSRRA